MQLAMEENDERKGRDVRAIQWLIQNRTEDDEMESFVMAIPGAFTSKWGIDVWQKVSEVKQYEDTNLKLNDPTIRSQSNADPSTSILPHHHSPLFQRTWHRLHSVGRIIGIRFANGTPHDVTRVMTQSMPRLPSDGQAPDDPYAHHDPAVYELCMRVRHLVGTCDNHSIFTKEELWFKRARGCVETVASLVICADIKPELFGDLGGVLHSIYAFFVREAHSITAPGSDGLFRGRFDCLSFVVVSQAMKNHDRIKLDARVAIEY